MRVASVVALDLLREAASRKWFLALGIALTLVIGGVGFALRLEVVDGAIAATRLFGTLLDTDIRPADVALAALYRGVAYAVFYCGLVSPGTGSFRVEAALPLATLERRLCERDGGRPRLRRPRSP